jgi:hypothetical protein
MYRFARAATLLIAVALVGCEESRTPTDVADLSPRFAKPTSPGGGGGGGDDGGETDPTAAFYLPVSEGLGLWGDGLEAYNTTITITVDDNTTSIPTIRYKEKECGVHAKIFATTEKSNSGDAIMHTSNPKYRDKKCPDYPRTVYLSYATPLSGQAAGETERVEVFVNLGELQNTTTKIAIGATEKRGLNINPEGTSRCDVLRLREQLRDGTRIGADWVNVTRIDARTWRVWSSPDEVDGDGNVIAHHDKAECSSDGTLFHLPVDFYIVADRDLP